ncbi:unnamed protein product [Acanthoscelides obtectus]|uniref:Uncharacterized protein n=1 Tax=Acanthoscelides obtectus TaxID=200917 RepID=A0A9P0L4S5_ACAOB|nr:unnamed protein product [Acanthoscelides obtectus]CAK1648266.1 hypothetical protein AOBTE_LOCUS15627 [Acanthoscelides obtectus]
MWPCIIIHKNEVVTEFISQRLNNGLYDIFFINFCSHCPLDLNQTDSGG